MVDQHPAPGSHSSVQLLRRILENADETWLHEQAGGDRQLLRRFRAQRRRSFYSCIAEIRGEAQAARERWRQAADRLQDYGGIDWPLEQTKLSLRLAWICLLAESHFTLGFRLNGAVRESVLGQLDRVTDFSSLATASN